MRSVIGHWSRLQCWSWLFQSSSGQTLWRFAGRDVVTVRRPRPGHSMQNTLSLSFLPSPRPIADQSSLSLLPPLRRSPPLLQDSRITHFVDLHFQLVYKRFPAPWSRWRVFYSRYILYSCRVLDLCRQLHRGLLTKTPQYNGSSWLVESSKLNSIIFFFKILLRQFFQKLRIKHCWVSFGDLLVLKNWNFYPHHRFLKKICYLKLRTIEFIVKSLSPRQLCLKIS